MRTLVVLAAAALVAGCTAHPAADRPPAAPPPPQETATSSTPAWHRVDDLPLSPRWRPLVAWTGEEALVVGGYDARIVGGPVPMSDLKDGAAYDPATGTWRPIADAPSPLGDYEPTITADHLLVVGHHNHLIAYDLDADTWRRLPDPPVQVPQPRMAADGDHLYVLDAYADEGQDAPVQVLDLDTNVWRKLPSTRLGLEDRYLVSTPEGLVVIGTDRRPATAGAELWDGKRWSRYPDSTVQGCCWHWTGDRVISPYRTTSWRSERFTFRSGALDPATGKWSALPWLPHESRASFGGGWPVADGPLAFSDSYLYDDRDRSSTYVAAPDPDLAEPGVALGGGMLMAFGGYEVVKNEGRIMDVRPTNQAWAMELPGAG